ncbi:MarR family transcriptional regulator [Candidatus Bathyarchaeota archaeon]|nr:MarR family transcriptional regulator [Candidatus Bathyarchaeota archaeon]
MPIKSKSLNNESSEISWRDQEVLEFLIAEELYGFTFDGIRKRLKIHQETLSRILGRLLELNIVEKVAVGYRVSERIYEFSMLPLRESSKKIQVLQTYIPSNISIENLLIETEGKWFDTLRWLGYSKNEDKVVFKWITSDSKAQIDAVFWDYSLTIEAKLLGNISFDKILNSSHKLLGYINDAIQNIPDLNFESYI